MGCHKPFQASSANLALSSGRTSAGPCTLPEDVSGSPKTIEQFVNLVNALPKPVSLACVVAALDRPLEVSLTRNQLSAQPAVGDRSPRIFVIKDNLFISFVPEGFGSNAIELGFLISETDTIKAEISFPVTSSLSYADPYKHIETSTGTSCTVCHGTEVRVPSISFANAFSSRAFQPRPETLVDLNIFKSEDHKCNFNLEPGRCEIIRAIFAHGEVKTKNFPETIPFMF